MKSVLTSYPLGPLGLWLMVIPIFVLGYVWAYAARPQPVALLRIFLLPELPAAGRAGDLVALAGLLAVPGLILALPVSFVSGRSGAALALASAVGLAVLVAYSLLVPAAGRRHDLGYEKGIGTCLAGALIAAANSYVNGPCRAASARPSGERGASAP
jgi:hypothetical protein